MTWIYFMLLVYIPTHIHCVVLWVQHCVCNVVIKSDWPISHHNHVYKSWPITFHDCTPDRSWFMSGFWFYLKQCWIFITLTEEGCNRSSEMLECFLSFDTVTPKRLCNSECESFVYMKLSELLVEKGKALYRHSGIRWHHLVVLRNSR